MLLPTSRMRVYVYRDACDMRKSFSGLVGLVRAEVTEDPLSGHLFLFMNRRRDYVKILWWDATGYCISGRFQSTPIGFLCLSPLRRI